MPGVDGHLYPLVVDQYVTSNRIFFLNPKGLYRVNGVPHWGGLARISQQSSVLVNVKGAESVSMNSTPGIAYPTAYGSAFPTFPAKVPITVGGSQQLVDRGEVLKAYQIAITPLPTSFPGLTRFRYRSTKNPFYAVLITGAAQKRYAQSASFSDCPYTVVDAYGNAYSYSTIADLLTGFEVA